MGFALHFTRYAPIHNSSPWARSALSPGAMATSNQWRIVASRETHKPTVAKCVAARAASSRAGRYRSVPTSRRFMRSPRGRAGSFGRTSTSAEVRLVPAARAWVGVLHGDGPPPPIKLAHHAGPDAGALALVDIAVDVEPRMHHRHVRREKAHVHLRRLAGARSKRPVGGVQAPHQVPEVGPGLGPCAVDGDELGVVEERLDHGVRVVSAPCLIEPQFNLADRIFICLGHHDLSGLAAVHAPRDYVSTTTPSQVVMTKVSVRLSLSGRVKNESRDRVGLRYEGKMPRLYLDRFRAHALGHEALEIGIDRAVFCRDSVPARLKPPC